MNLRVKVIRCDNGTEFKNKEMNQLCKMKGIMRQYSVARTPQQNGVAERRNRTLIKAARTMLADSKFPTTFWAEAVNTSCYVQNTVLVIKPHNKTPYELFHGRTPALSFMRPFGCLITILNTIDHLGKFDGKVDEGFFVGYSLNSKAYRVLNSRTKIVEENLHVRFSENTPNSVGTKASNNAGKAKEKEPVKDYILLPLWTADPPFFNNPKSSQDDGFQPTNDGEKKVDKESSKEDECKDKGEEESTNNTNRVNTVSSNINASSSSKVNTIGTNISIDLTYDPNMPELEEIGIFEDASDDEEVGAEDDIHNLEPTFTVSPILTTRIHKDRPLEQVIGDLHSAPQTRRISKNLEEHGFVSNVISRTNHKDL
ncbi:retrovirus-related pol polyprotein from transposon TNT 1-94 [Tanacetum coccineum]